MHRSIEKDLSFLEVLFGLLLQPAATVEGLFHKRPPPYALSLQFCLFCTVLVPIITQVLTLDVLAYRSDVLISAFVFLLVTAIFILLVLGFFLRLLQIQIPLDTLFRCISYCTAPAILAIWSIYIVNYFSSGRLTIITKLVTGYAALDPRVLWLSPFAIGVANLSGLLIFYHCIRVAGGLGPSTALMAGLLSQIPLIFSVFLGLAVVESIVPGTLRLLTELTPYRHELMSLFESLHIV